MFEPISSLERKPWSVWTQKFHKRPRKTDDQTYSVITLEKFNDSFQVRNLKKNKGKKKRKEDIEKWFSWPENVWKVFWSVFGE